MNVLFDTNVILDVLLAREPYVEAAAKLFALVDNGPISGMICATTLTTVFYIAAKDFGRRRALDQVRALLDLFDVAAVDGNVLGGALNIEIADYENAVLHEAARSAHASAIVTRDQVDFSNSQIPVLAPRELLAAIAASTRDSSAST
ncbi:MAG: PIN domain-containing protein [Spirochaetaceae bacterium]|nr:MAG: PIN domain-containing protein [Spirochaetaceae bacterium]